MATNQIISQTTRYLSKEEWIRTHASGTLRHAFNLNCAVQDMYLHERVAFTLGSAFSAVPKSRITTGTIIALPDSSTFTEATWNIRRRKAESLDSYSDPLYITVYEDSTILETGLGILCLEPLDFLPESFVAYAIIAPCNKNYEYTGEVRAL